MASRVRRTRTNLAASRGLLEVELERRYEQTGVLVAAARSAGMGSGAVTPLVGARSFVVGVRAAGLTLGEQAGAENALSAALHRVATAAEDPRFRNDWAVQRPTLDLQVTAQRLVGAARVYNDHAAATNAMLRGRTGPVARLLGVEPAPLFEAAVRGGGVAAPAPLGEEAGVMARGPAPVARATAD